MGSPTVQDAGDKFAGWMYGKRLEDNTVTSIDDDGKLDFELNDAREGDGRGGVIWGSDWQIGQSNDVRQILKNTGFRSFIGGASQRSQGRS
jgi:hypothetical protein